MSPMSEMSSMLPPLTWEALLHIWEWRPVWDAVIVLLLVAYMSGFVAARRPGRAGDGAGVHPARVGSFVAGSAVLFVILNSAVDVNAAALFWDHMVEHLLLIMVGRCLSRA